MICADQPPIFYLPLSRLGQNVSLYISSKASTAARLLNAAQYSTLNFSPFSWVHLRNRSVCPSTWPVRLNASQMARSSASALTLRRSRRCSSSNSAGRIARHIRNRARRDVRVMPAQKPRMGRAQSTENALETSMNIVPTSTDAAGRVKDQPSQCSQPVNGT